MLNLVEDEDELLAHIDEYDFSSDEEDEPEKADGLDLDFDDEMDDDAILEKLGLIPPSITGDLEHEIQPNLPTL